MNKQLITQPKRLFTLLSVLMLTACSQSATTSVESGKLAQTTIDSATVAIDAMKTVGDLNEEQISCLDKIDFNPALAKVEDILADNFSEEELKQLNDVYASEAGKAFTQYGRERILLAIGGKIENPSPEPTAEQVKIMKDFAKTELGQKYIELNQQEGKGSITAEINEFIRDEADDCGVGTYL